jgi:hypothetical protein
LAISTFDLAASRLLQRAGFRTIGTLCLALNKSPFEGTMKKLWIGVVAVTLTALPGTAGAFEVQGATVVLPEATSPFGGEGLNSSRPGGSLNLLRDEPDLPGLPQYGNSIAIPGPGVEAPAWSYSSRYFQQ